MGSDWLQLLVLLTKQKVALHHPFYALRISVFSLLICHHPKFSSCQGLRWKVVH